MSEAHEVEEADHAKCVHPGWPLLTGWDAVRSSWEAIFESTEEMRFTLGDVRVSVTTVLATNLFERAPDGWRMVHHHASHVLGSMPEAAA